MAWKALIRLFGFGKKEEVTATPSPRTHPYEEITDEQLAENNRPPRTHPYDEISDEQLEENRNKPPRVHPYDEISDEQLAENRKRPPRTHPYDEVSEEQLAENRNKQVRAHPYDEVTEEQLTQNRAALKQSRGKRPDGGQDCENVNSAGRGAKVKGQAKQCGDQMEMQTKSRILEDTPQLNYVEVEVQRGAGGSDVAKPSSKHAQPTIYSEVRPNVH